MERTSRHVPLRLPALALSIGFSIAASGAPPANDSCATATVITLAPSTINQDVREASSNASDPGPVCAPIAKGKSVWFSFTPSKTDVYSFSTAGSSPVEDFTPVIQVFTGSCGGLIPVAQGCGAVASGLLLTEGVKYTVMVGALPVTIDPEIHIQVNGFDPCENIQPGPGGGSAGCPDPFEVRVTDNLTARAFNRLSNAPIFSTAGTFTWAFGGPATPAAGTGSAVAYKYTEPADNASVELTFTAEGTTLARTARVKVLGAAAARNADAIPGLRGSGAELLDTTVTVPSPGGTLRFSVFPTQLDYSYHYQIPSVAFASGLNTFFTTDLVLTNWHGIEAKFFLRFINNVSGQETVVGPLSVAGFGTREFPSIVKDTFRTEGVGTLIVEASRPLLPGARTYAPAPKGTNGQFALAYDLSAHPLRYGEFGLLTGLRHDGVFRTNLGFFAKGIGTCIAELVLFGSDGNTLGTNPVRMELQPDIYKQDNIASIFGVSDALRAVSVRVTSATQGCEIGGVAYVIDNDSSDPYVVGMRK
ncbi:MAG: hypothetical protein IT186_01780 [Acidobacteria bacterium]|nr:hypothetical protein [Acidobacteriota bacterium]MCK6683774.1 hypothetical protein [Thermoanaerobaculia bacterium]